MAQKTGGFTLVEMLVVVTIIAMLVAMLLPSMRMARYAGQLVVCLSNARQHGIAAVTIAGDNRGGFPSHTDTAPERYRTNGAANSLWTQLNAGRYLPADGKFSICPIIATEWATAPGDAQRYRDPSYTNGSYGGWATPTKNIITLYLWTANWVSSTNGTTPAGGVSITYYDGEPPWPGSRLSTARPAALLTTHRITSGGVPFYNIHSLGHSGKGLSVDSILPITAEQPVVRLDISGILRQTSDIKSRASINSSNSTLRIGDVYY